MTMTCDIILAPDPRIEGRSKNKRKIKERQKVESPIFNFDRINEEVEWNVRNWHQVVHSLLPTNQQTNRKTESEIEIIPKNIYWL